MFKIFQFYFNPKSKKEVRFESFCFVPSKRKEKQLGDLYLIGEIKNIPLTDKKLIDTLGEIIKNEYYSLPERKGEESLKEALLKADEFLSKKLREERYSWLGSVNFLVVSVSEDLSIRFSEIGKIKIFILREEEIFDLGRKEVSNSGTFSSMASGKLIKGDRLLILTQELSDKFWENKIFSELKKVKRPKELKKLIKKKKNLLRNFFGVLVFVFIKKRKLNFYFALPKIRLPQFNLPRLSFTLRKPLFRLSFSLPKILPQSPALREAIKESIVKILILIILLMIGYLLFNY